MNRHPSFRSHTPEHGSSRDRLGLIADEAASRRRDFTPAASDRMRVELLLIDMQTDFCHPNGTLFVGGENGLGALEDCYRVADFVYRNVETITRITPTLDTHVPGQIFFTSFWVDAEGNAPPPFTVVTTNDIKSGRLRFSSAALSAVPEYVTRDGRMNPLNWLGKQVSFYVDALEKDGKYALILWPYHCLIGTEGHALTRPIRDAALYHSISRDAALVPVSKGDEPWTESYSVFRNEVGEDCRGLPLNNRTGHALATRLTDSTEVDAVIVAGEASSHCVQSSLDDLLDIGLKRDPDFAKRVFVLKDCMSAVVMRGQDGKPIDGLDFRPQAEAAFSRWSAAGVNIVTSDMPVEDWPVYPDLLRDGSAQLR